MIAERLIWAPKPALLIVDEAQHLKLEAVEALRAIHDSTGVGLVLSGNESVYAKLTGGTRRAEFAQLFSRVGRRLRLDRPSPGDVAAILQAWRIEGIKERELCQQIASLPGGLRGLVNVLVDATTAAQAMGRAVDLKALRAAWSDQGAMQ
jgi:DNA transposition AAA+ family ATPase